jgi:hypothetical protein
VGKFMEQRDATRREVFGGNAQVRALRTKGYQSVAERARIVNWSRGGLLLKLPSPQRKLMFLKQDPCLAEGEQVLLTLRLPPAYRDIKVLGEVVHARRPKRTPNTLWVGVEFDQEAAGFDDALRAMAKLLEPRSRSARVRRQRQRSA